MEKEFVPYELALLMKIYGFNEPCLAGYNSSSGKLEYYSRPLVTKDSFTVDAPAFSQAFRWFREKYGIMHRITSYAFGYQIHLDNTPDNSIIHVDRRYDSDVDYKTYEEAEISCLEKLIEIIEGKEVEKVK